MKEVQEVTACVVDYGTFVSVAKRLSSQYAKVYYYSPFEEEYLDARKCVIGDGIDGVERLDDPLDPDVFDKIDLWIFPDIGFGGFQRHLRSLGKAVWGSMGADRLELYRTLFIKTLQELDLPLVNSVKLQGLSKLSDHLKTVKDKWVKINRYRANMETWKHIDYEHSIPELNRLAVEFGGVQEHVWFVVQDQIETEIEIGYDGWSVDGWFPDKSFQGYEKKNELYLGSWMNYDDLPEAVRYVNEKFSTVMEKYGYRNDFATELRVLDDVPYFIDPTMRMPGQTGEHLLNTCSNLAEVKWKGANGELIQPEFTSRFSTESTLHYTACSENWRTLRLPEECRNTVMMYRYCEADGMFHFPPGKNDEVGVVCGQGDTIEDSIDDLKANLELLKDEPVTAHLDGFVDLIKSINEAQKNDIKFTDQKIPSPTSIVDA